MSNLDIALDYLNFGFSIIPVKKDKKPAIGSWLEYQKRQPTDAEVREWFRNPETNIGIVTGKVSNLTVIDCDSDSATEAFLSNYHGDTTSVKTPKGRHFYFHYLEGSRNGARVLPDTDVRSEGGYVVAPPSTNGNGGSYSWIRDYESGCDDPSVLLSFISLSAFTYMHGGGADSDNAPESKEVKEVKTSQTYFCQGTRDEDIFSIANALRKLKYAPDFIEQALTLVARGCNPPYPEKDIPEKIKSAMNRQIRREMSMKDEIKEWIESKGVKNESIQVKDFYFESNVVKKEEKHAAIVAFKSLCDEGILQSCGQRSGEYRIVDRTDTEQEWWKDDGKPLKIVFPLGIEEFAKVFAGNVILLEGQKSQGKSTFALEFVRLNHGLFPGRALYQNIEMADSEIKDRFQSYEHEDIIKADEWRNIVKIIRQTEAWQDKIQPDGLNVVDYLLEYEKAYTLPKHIWEIHKKLKTGIALVAVQRDPFKPYPTGGRGVRDIPRLVISLIHHTLRLEDVKSFWPSTYGNPTNLQIKYKQVAWCKWRADGTWKKAEDDKYAGFVKEKEDA